MRSHKVFFAGINGEVIGGEHPTQEAARQACQDHFNTLCAEIAGEYYKEPAERYIAELDRVLEKFTDINDRILVAGAKETFKQLFNIK